MKLPFSVKIMKINKHIIYTFPLFLCKLGSIFMLTSLLYVDETDQVYRRNHDSKEETLNN
jgi:hypothetical protein